MSSSAYSANTKIPYMGQKNSNKLIKCILSLITGDLGETMGDLKFSTNSTANHCSKEQLISSAVTLLSPLHSYAQLCIKNTVGVQVQQGPWNDDGMRYT